MQAVHAVVGDVDDEPLRGQAAAHGRGKAPFVFYHEHPHRPSVAHPPDMPSPASQGAHSAAYGTVGYMIQAPKLSRRARWAIPAGALVITGGVLAGSLITAAQAAPGLPARTAAQLLAEVADSTPPPLTGTVVETASFGLPSLPATGNPTSLSSLLTGSHTIRVWYASPAHFRLAVPQSLSESDVIRDGRTAWLWQSTLNKVTKFTLPAHAAEKVPESVPQQPLTPQQAAQQVLAAVGPTTTVRVDSNVTVAGQAAYALVLAPKDARSLVGQVQIDVDGDNGVPLRLQVFARGASSPAFQVGYTDIAFVKPGRRRPQLHPAAGRDGHPGEPVGRHPGGAKDHATPRRHHDRVRLADRARAAVVRPDPERSRRRRPFARRRARPCCAPCSTRPPRCTAPGAAAGCCGPAWSRC